jgi:sugar lactone lactonase YvrE
MGGAIQGTALALSDGNVNKVSTLAGIAGIAGFNNYSATSSIKALFNHPTDITTDGTDFYVTDYGNSVIRKISPSGLSVTTLQCTDENGLPSGFNHPSGITTDGTNLYVVDSGSNSIRFITIATNKVYRVVGSTTGLAGSVDSTDITEARFNLPIGITTDGVNLYVTDYNNATVRRIVIATGAVSTLAGTSGEIGSVDGELGAARFNRPGRITTDRVNLYLTDTFNRIIRKIDILTGTVTTIAGTAGPLSADAGTTDGIGTAARFNLPNGITTDGTHLYVTDMYQNTIRKIVIATGNVTTIAGIPKPDPGDPTLGTGGAVDSAEGAPSFYTPEGITTDGTSLYVADFANNTIRKIE